MVSVQVGKKHGYKWAFRVGEEVVIRQLSAMNGLYHRFSGQMDGCEIG